MSLKMNLKKVGLFSIGPAAAALLSFISLPILTWIFSPDVIGKFEILRLVCSFSVLVFSFGLDQAYVREYHESTDKIKLLKVALLPPTLIMLSCASVLYAYKDFFIYALYESSNANLFAITIIAVFVSVFSRFLSLVFRMGENGLLYSISMALPRLLTLVGLLIFLYSEKSWSFEDLSWLHVISLLLVLIWMVATFRSELFTNWKGTLDKKLIKSMTSYGFPLMLSSFAYWGLTAMDRVFLNTYSTLEEVGIYSVAARFAAGAAIFQQVFSTVWAPTIYKWASEDSPNLNKIDDIVDKVLAVVIVLFCLGGLLSWVLGYILPKVYYDVQFIFVPCLAFPLFYTLSEVTVIGVGITKKTHFALGASILALCVNLVLNWWLVPILGARGAAISTAIAFYVFFIARTESSVFVWISFKRKRMYLFTGFVLILLVGQSLLGKENLSAALFLWFLLLVVSVIWNRNSLSSLFSAKGLKY